MRLVSQEKFELLLKSMQENNLDVLLIKDGESSPDVNLHYLSGHPMDATLLITATGETTLIPWDIPLAEEHADVDSIIDPSNYQYSDVKIFTEYFNEAIKKSSFTLGVNENLPYSSVILLETEIPNIKVFREPKKVYNFLQELRETKSDYELKKLREAARIGSKAINDIQKFVKNATDETENDLSFLVRKKLAEYGADDLAFQSLVGNTTRSHLLHCHPRSSNQQLAKPGLALIDFGANYKGYNSDITVPISFGSLSEEQQKMKKLTLEAYEASIEIIDMGVPLWKIDEAARTVLKNGGYEMPHSLGHGLGLTVHDAPGIRRKPTDKYQLKYWKEDVIEEGMVFTIEPGCYKAGLGGQRLENDVLINHNGKVEVITDSHFIDVE
ncbi:MAG: M24 family metallopeptidase [Candidatus Hermodarchaeota archaeon]